jgi:adenylate kinase family enzyme
MCRSRIILIGGSSHVGKSTLAEFIAAKLGWQCISTDRLARHPGRPWKTDSAEIPSHVAEHYLSLSPDELIEDVLSHYKNLWPRIRSILTEHLDRSTTGLVMEGSAL